MKKHTFRVEMDIHISVFLLLLRLYSETPGTILIHPRAFGAVAAKRAKTDVSGCIMVGGCYKKFRGVSGIQYDVGLSVPSISPR